LRTWKSDCRYDGIAMTRPGSTENLVQTSEALAAVDEDHEPASIAVRLTQRLQTAEAALARFRRALEVGWDPVALTEQCKAAVAEKRPAEAELSAVKLPERVSAGSWKTWRRHPNKPMRSLYGAVGLQVSCKHETKFASCV
jgi:hypothetical protein